MYLLVLLSTYITLNADNSKSFLHFIISNFLIPTQYKHAFTPALADIPLHDDIDELLVQLDAITDAVCLLAGHERGAGAEERSRTMQCSWTSSV